MKLKTFLFCCHYFCSSLLFIGRGPWNGNWFATLQKGLWLAVCLCINEDISHCYFNEGCRSIESIIWIKSIMCQHHSSHSFIYSVFHLFTSFLSLMQLMIKLKLFVLSFTFVCFFINAFIDIIQIESSK